MLKYANLQFIIPLYKDLEVNGFFIVLNEVLSPIQTNYRNGVQSGRIW